MRIDRRDFLKGIAAGGLVLAAETPSALARDPRTLPPKALGILYDATLCVGCKACVPACKDANQMPPEHTSKDQLWDDPIDLSGRTLNIIKLYRHGEGNVKDTPEGYSYVKRQCMHCVDPSCISACPVSALTKDPGTGVVSYNKKACIGCRYCQVACPYNIPKFEWDNPFPQIRKCQLCSHRYEEGKYAACCEVCPTGASLFGPVGLLREEARRRLSLEPGRYARFPLGRVDGAEDTQRAAAAYYPRVYGEREGGGTQVLLLAGVPFEKLGIPELSDVSDASKSEVLQHTIYKGLILPITLLGGLLYAVYRNTREKEEDR